MQIQIGRHDDANAIALAEMMEMQWPATGNRNVVMLQTLKHATRDDMHMQ